MPSDDKIDGYKDFGRILADHRNLTQPLYNRPLYKNPKAFAGLFLILAIVMLVFWTVDKDNKKEKELKEKSGNGIAKTSMPAPSYPAPLTASLAMPAELMHKDFSKPQRLSIDGLEFNFPADAFEDENGNSISGPIDVKVQIAQNKAEWAAMGVPLVIGDSPLISQYIIDISASFDGKPVQLRKGKAIDVIVPAKGNDVPALFQFAHPSQAWNHVVNSNVHKSNIDLKRLGLGDGFGVVEFDENGKPLPQKAENDSTSIIKLFQFDIPVMGMYTLGEKGPKIFEKEAGSRSFVNAKGEKLELHTVYGFPQGKNTLMLFHPKTKAYDFELRFLEATPSTFMAILPDGRIANSQPVQYSEKTENLTIEMQISDAPVENLEDLTQRMAEF